MIHLATETLPVGPDKAEDSTMRRVADYRDNARACRELAHKMPEAHCRQLLAMAVEWERIADDEKMRS